MAVGSGVFSKKEKAFNIVNGVFMSLICVVILYPFWNILVQSLSPASYAKSLGIKLWPPVISFEAYKMVITTSVLPRAYANTIIRTVVGTSLSVSATIIAAYVLSFKKLPFRNAMTAFLFITMYVDGGLIPTYLLMRSLKLYNNFWVLILPSLISAYNVFIARNFLSSLPESLRESAYLDGAGDFTVFTKIVLPLSKPIIATLALWSAVGHWNAWFDAMLYIKNQDLIVLQLLLKRTMDQAVNTQFETGSMLESMQAVCSENINAAIIILTIGPIVMVYPFIQKYLIKGVMIGSIKG